MFNRQNDRAFTLIELLVVVAIIALLIAILLPSLARARESGKRTTCASNIKGLSSSCSTYAHDNRGEWPQVPTYRDMPVLVPGPFRSMGSASAGSPLRDEPSADDNLTGQNVSPSRCLWMLLRRGDVAAKSFICPSSSEDTVDNTEDVNRFYDFKGYGYLSYGYQMPYYVRDNQCRPSQKVDPRMVLLGDKNPGMTRGTDHVQYANPAEVTDDFKSAAVTPPLQNTPPANAAPYLHPDLSPEELKPFNSPNHGGRGEGEGQNVGRAEGSVQFVNTPLAGVTDDNIYSVHRRTGPNDPNARMYTGWYPDTVSQNRGCPGYQAMSNNPARPVHTSTDTLLVP